MMSFNKKILIVAEHASLKFGGEAALPLHYFRVLRQRNIEAWLIVHERTRKELETLFPQDSDRIYYITDTVVHRLLWRGGKLLPKRLSTFTFGSLLRLTTQIMQRRIAQQIIRKHDVDLVHQPIPVSPKEPSMIFDLGVPIVIGPMNGGMTYPVGFQALESPLVSLSVKIGRISANFLNRIIPGKLKATTLLVANPRTKKALPQGTKGKIVELIENGVDLSIWQQSTQSPVSEHVKLNPTLQSAEPEKPTKFVFIGRLVDWKAVDLLLLAFERLVQQIPAKLEIIGDGVERPKLELLAQKLDLISLATESSDLKKPEAQTSSNLNPVQFTGWLSQVDCAEKLRSADVMVLPSLFECGGAVVLEAMTMSLPVIATDWGGPADYIDSTCGILVQPHSREFFVEKLSQSMLKLADSLDLRCKMGQSGHQRILDNFDWEKKLDSMLEIYLEAIDRYSR